MKDIEIWTGKLEGYKLLDSGNKKKLEEVAGIRLVRSEPRAWWTPKLSSAEWERADGKFETEKGKWHFKNGEPQNLALSHDGVTLKLKFPSNSKHFGVFPEQVSQWNWIGKELDKRPSTKTLSSAIRGQLRLLWLLMVPMSPMSMVRVPP